MRHRELQALLIRAGLVNGELIERARVATAGTATTWLEYLVQRKLIDEGEVAAAAGRAMFLPVCERDRLEAVPAEVIAAVAWDLAIEHRLVPLYVEPEGDLRIALLDPCDTESWTEAQFFLGRRVLREVAPATSMAWALHRYYGARTPLWPPAQRRPATLRSKPSISIQVSL